MNYLLVYDIANDKARLRAAKLLEGAGDRVQRSVWELPDLPPAVLERLLRRLERDVPLEEGDSIRLYPLCERCRGAVRVWGDGPPPMDNPDVIIV